MYDRLTHSLWHQFTGVPIVGDLQGSGIELEFFPTARTTWGEWVAEHPDTTVLSREGARYAAWFYLNESDDKAIYFEYRADPETMFPIAVRDPVLATKAEVLGVSVGDVHRAYAISDLRSERVVHDELAGMDVVVVASGVSSDAHVYDNGLGRRFRLPDDAPDAGLPEVLLDDEGCEWRVDRYGLEREGDGAVLLRAIPSNVSFWFGWFAFHPDTTLYERDGEDDAASGRDVDAVCPSG